MSRSGYDNFEGTEWDSIRWAGAVKQALRGKRGQAFLREMLAALDALPAPRLIADELVYKGDVCAIGAVGVARGIDMAQIDPDDYWRVAEVFGIARTLAAEIAYWNDEGTPGETPEQRFASMRRWVVKQLRNEEALRG